VSRRGANALGEVLEPGRVPDCYLGLRLDPAGDAEGAGVLVVAPAVLLHPVVPQPDGTLLYELLTGHPDRAPHELVFIADLTVALRAWPTDTWAKVGVDPPATTQGVVAGWQRGDLPRRRLGGLTARRPCLGAAGHDLCPRSACRSAAATGGPGLPAPVAAGQRPPGRRPPRGISDISPPRCLRHCVRRTVVVRTAVESRSARRPWTRRQVTAGVGCRSRPGCADGVGRPGRRVP
jgi:hypothetical protein